MMCSVSHEVAPTPSVLEAVRLMKALRKSNPHYAGSMLVGLSAGHQIAINSSFCKDLTAAALG